MNRVSMRFVFVHRRGELGADICVWREHGRILAARFLHRHVTRARRAHR
jgi:hypothetical protein